MKIQKRHFDKYASVFFVIGFVLMFIITSDVREHYSSFMFPTGLAFVIVASIKSFIKSFKSKCKINEFAFGVLWIVFCLSFIPSYISGNVGYAIFLRYIFMYVFYIVLIGHSELDLKTLSLSMMFAGIYIAYRCFIEVGIYIVYYQGTTINPNQFALILSGFILGCLYLLIKGNKILKVLAMLVLISCIVLLFYSSCRTVMLLVVFDILAMGLFHYKNNSHKDGEGKILIDKRVFVGVSIALCAVILVILKYFGNIYSFIFEKWGSQSSHILSGRTDIWKEIFSGVSITGNINSTINANNDFFDWLLKYGILVFIMYCTIIIYILILSIKNFKCQMDWDNLFMLLIVISYIGFSFFENIHALFGKPINVLFWCVVAMLLKKRDLRE